MAHFLDGSNYCYSGYFEAPGMVNVSWLADGVPFPRHPQSEDLQSLIWRYKILGRPSGGAHECELCTSEPCVE